MALGVFPNGFSEAYFLRQYNYTSYDKTTIQCMMRHRGMLSTAFDKVAINKF